MQVETTIDLRYNIAALYIAILREDIRTVEHAFAVLEDNYYRLTDKDTLDMMAMRKQGMSWNDIGAIYKLHPSSIHRRIRTYKKRTESGGNQIRSATK